MNSRPKLLLVLACLGACPARAADFDARVVDRSGRPVTDAVVTIRPDAGVPAGPIRFPWGTAMAQQNIQFAPRTLIVPIGATVSFPNKDKVRHHVYSFSKAARFEFKLYGRDESRSYTFKSTGAVAVGCNIHDMMRGFIKVVDTPYAATTNASGAARIAGLPAGQATVTVWHPTLRGKDNELILRLRFPASGTTTKRLDLDLR